MADAVAAEAEQLSAVGIIAEAARSEGPGAASRDGATDILRVPNASGVLFHPFGTARTGGYNHLGLKLEE